ncbi:YcaO-like family protein [Kitasatospora sp. NPDC086791]|uniref:YcaO-like family protein n=1 Tax=Kitasatospora sp. NPDC086791 TaxID=3155178 RepID=UPI003438B694
MTAPAPATESAAVPAPAALIGPGAPDWPWQRWAAARPGLLLAARADLDHGWERRAMAAARTARLPLLSVRVFATEAQIGPLWPVDGRSACPGCVQAAADQRRGPAEQRPEQDRAARERSGGPALRTGATGTGTDTRTGSDSATGTGTKTGSGSGSGAAAFPPWLGEAVGALLDPSAPLAPGELVRVSADGAVTRHRITRTFRCRLCAPEAAPLLAAPGDPGPPPLTLARRPTRAAVPTRQGAPFDGDAELMRRTIADARFGPVVRMTRNSAGAYPMTEVELLAGTPPGIGRGSRFREAEAIGMYEALERFGGYPHTAPIVPGVSRRRLTELGVPALDVRRLGVHTDRQYAAATSRVRPWTEDTALDWTWSRPLDGGPPVLVPAEAGFYRYGYGLRAEPGREPPRRCLLESSSGSALGNSFEEAALHSLLELAERDAFLLAWHGARPLPEIDPASVRDPDSRAMLRLASDRGYRVHLLVATADLAVPVVWALAVRPDRALPASFSTAGCHPDPEAAVRSALWELSQLVAAGLAWDPEPLRPMVEDPWLVESIAHHWRRFTFPELLPRVERVLGGPVRPLSECFGDWPRPLTEAAGGDVTGALEFVVELYRRAGLTGILAVDQSTPDHRALGTAVVKCVVPGIVPVCFGLAHQRLAGLPRLAAATAGADPDQLLRDPHPFP